MASLQKNEAHNDPKVNIDEYYQVGDTVKAKVIEFNKQNWVLKLSVKRLLNQAKNLKNIWVTLMKQKVQH